MVQTVVQANLQKARAEAQQICSIQGDASPACVASWDVVKELQSALAEHRDRHALSSVYEDYCRENPNSLECRIYDV